MQNILLQCQESYIEENNIQLCTLKIHILRIHLQKSSGVLMVGFRGFRCANDAQTLFWLRPCWPSSDQNRDFFKNGGVKLQKCWNVVSKIFQNLRRLFFNLGYTYTLTTGINFMVVLGAYAPGSCDFAPRCWSIGAEFVNGHIYHHFEHFESFSFFKFFYLLILPKSAKKCIWKHIFFKFFWRSMLQDHLTWTVCLWQNLRCVVLVQGFICS